MAENFAVKVREGHSHITHGADLLDLRVVREQFQQIIREMNEVGALDHFLAGGAGDRHLVILHPLPIQPKGETPKPTGIFEVLDDPSTVGLQGSR